MTAEAFAHHRREAAVHLAVDNAKKARAHLVEAARCLRPFVGADVEDALVETARAMAAALVLVFADTSEVVEALATLRAFPAKHPPLRRDVDGQAYTFDAFVDFYGLDSALAEWDSREVVRASRVYSKAHMRLIRSQLDIPRSEDHRWLVVPVPKQHSKKKPPAPPTTRPPEEEEEEEGKQKKSGAQGGACSPVDSPGEETPVVK